MTTPRTALRHLVMATLFCLGTGHALAQVKVGVTIPLSGPVAMLGTGQKKAMEFYPTKIGDLSVEYVTLDDASDTTTAVNNARKLVAEHNVDVIIGSSTTPQCLAMVGPVAETETPQICLGSASAIVAPMDAKRKWVFKIPPNDAVYVDAIRAHMAATGVQKVAFIGFNDAFGEAWLKELNRLAGQGSFKMSAVEHYSRTDTSVLAQVMKVMAVQPDAVVIVASGSPAALPVITLRERGYKGKVYLNASVATKEFFDTAGPAADGALLTVGVGLVAEQVPDSHPLKKLNLEFKQRYEAKFGAGSFNIFSQQGFDAFRILERAVPLAAAKAKPGTKAFKTALRDAIEGIKDLYGNTGIYSFTPDDHSGLDRRALVMGRVEKGRLVYVPDVR